jgi:hypothetical protein
MHRASYQVPKEHPRHQTLMLAAYPTTKLNDFR